MSSAKCTKFSHAQGLDYPELTRLLSTMSVDALAPDIIGSSHDVDHTTQVGADLTNDFSIKIQIWKKICFAEIPFMAIS